MRFIEFVHVQYDINIEELLQKIKINQIDPIESLDTFCSFLAKYKRENSEKIRYSNNTICDYITVAKEFLNGEKCKIYQEDIKQ